MSSSSRRSRSSSGPSARPEDDVGALRIFAPSPKDGLVPVPAETTLFQCTASVICFALDLLECRSSVWAMKNITLRIAKRNRNKPFLRGLKDDKDTTHEVNQYMGAIRQGFPHVVVSSEYGMAPKNGRTSKVEYHHPYAPKASGSIELNGFVRSTNKHTYGLILT